MRNSVATLSPSTPAKVRRIVETPEQLALIEKAKQGDPVAFEELYNMHHRRVMGLCMRMAGNVHAQAEDYLQEAFLRLYRKLSLFNGDCALLTWIYRLTVNVILTDLRKNPAPPFSLDEEPGPNAPPFRRDVARDDLELLGSVDRITLERVVEKLPPGYRLVFVLHDVEGCEHKEIAEMLDCSLGNSKSQLHKARKRIRELLLPAGAASATSGAASAAMAA